jgi:hypothetical protein
MNSAFAFFLLVMNEISCSLILCAAMPIYLRRHPKCIEEHLVQVALGAVSVGAFAGLLPPVTLTVGMVSLRFGVAIFAVRALVSSRNRRRLGDKVFQHDPSLH